MHVHNIASVSLFDHVMKHSLFIVIVIVATADYEVTVTLLYHAVWDNNADNHLYCLHSNWCTIG